MMDRVATGRDDNMRQQLAEDQYYCAGRPYYKLYPEMLAALAKISIDIDAGLLRLPFPAFRIDFPRDVYREHDDAPYMRGLLVTGRRMGDPNTKATLRTTFRPAGHNDPSYITIDADFGNEKRSGMMLPCKPFVIIETRGGATMRERIEEAFNYSNQDGTTEYVRKVAAKGYFPGQEYMASWARIAIGIAFFAINRHEVVISDIPAGLKAKLDRAKASGSKKRITRARSHIHPYRRGFTVGKELLIPRSLTDSDDGESTGRELRFAHLRTGHMRWQAHGHEMQERKLIFIPPTVVRKDLPLKDPTPRGVRYE